MPFIQGKIIHGLGEYSGTFFSRDFGQERVYRVSEAAMWRQGMIGGGCISDLV